MQILARRTILMFCEKHPSAKQQALAWHDEVAKAKWTNTQDIKYRYASASFVGRNRVVFNLKGNVSINRGGRVQDWRGLHQVHRNAR